MEKIIELLNIIINKLNCNKIPLPTKLMSEYLNNEDIDGNGLIYGKDFVVDDPPPVIFAVNSSILKEKKDIRILTLDQLKKINEQNI